MDLMDYRRKIIASSPHLSHAEGAVASFADGTDLPLKSLLVNIEPVQSGSGDPSPSNISPISGWSAVTIKNGSTTSATISLGCTVYGGMLNVPTGELVVTHRIRHITSSASFSTSTNAVYMSCLDLVKSSNYVPKIICDKLTTATKNSGSMGVYTVTGYNDPNNTYPTQNWLYFRVAQTMSVTVMKNWLDEVGGIDVAYELATPITYQLDPQTVRSLVGQNNIFADTGNTSLDYWAHP